MKNESTRTIKEFNEFCMKVSMLTDEQFDKVIYLIHQEQSLQCDLPSET